MKTYLYKIIAITLFLAACAFSCEKENMGKYAPDCKTGNCVSVNIRGALRVKPSGAGLNNVPVNVYFDNSHLSRVPIFTTQRKVATGKTNKNGEFDFKVTIDTKTFEDFRLIVEIPEQKKYIAVSGYFKSFGSINEEVIQNINFVFYEKTTLTINLIRTQTDEFDYFSGTYRFDNNYRTLLPTIRDSKNAIWQIETGADVYTKITWIKRFKEKTIYENADSLICKPKINNVYNINF